jgi:molybdopterin-guanine dinucleotide biosynthesis protein A
MAKTFKQVLQCVVNTVRSFCFEGASITDDAISTTTISKLPLTQDPHMPGVSPLAGLAAALKKCVDTDIPLTEDWLNDHLSFTVKQVTQYIYNQAEA